MATTLEITIYEDGEYGEGRPGQEKYLYRGVDDLGWSGDLEEVLRWVREDMVRLKMNPNLSGGFFGGPKHVG